jgi:hypothetical protein
MARTTICAYKNAKKATRLTQDVGLFQIPNFSLLLPHFINQIPLLPFATYT